MKMNNSRRNELREIIREISEKNLQESYWIKGDDYPNVSGIDEIFHFFFDDTDLAENSDSEIGNILLNGEEAIIVRMICSALNEMHERLGDVNSTYYMEDEKWNDIINLAKIMSKYMIDS